MRRFFAIFALAVGLFAMPGVSHAQLTFHIFHNFETAVHGGDINVDTTGNGGDTFKVALSNTAMTASWTQFSQVTEISGGNGYTAGGAEMATQSLSQTTGAMTWVGDTVSWTASSGSIGPARYFVLYSDTSTNDLLVGWWDYGSEFTVADGQDLTLTLTTLLTITTTASLTLPEGVIQLGAERWDCVLPNRQRLLSRAA
jgi:hypothetical protein